MALMKAQGLHMERCHIMSEMLKYVKKLIFFRLTQSKLHPDNENYLNLLPPPLSECSCYYFFL